MVYDTSNNNRTTTTTTTTDVTDSSVSAVERKEKEHEVRIIRAMTLKQVSKAPILVRRNASGIV